MLFYFDGMMTTHQTGYTEKNEYTIYHQVSRHLPQIRE